MIDVRLLQLVENAIVGFNPNNSEDIIKAEKFLRAEAKLNTSIATNDIEKFVAFFKLHGDKYSSFLKDNFIRNILEVEEQKSDFIFDEEELKRVEHFILENEAVALSFSVDFEDNYWNFLHKNCINNQWNLVFTFLNVAPQLLSVKNENKLTKILEDKFDLLLYQLTTITQIENVENLYNFCINPYFFKTLSIVNEANFKSKIITAYNYFISQKRVANSTHYKILFSICHFTTALADLNDLFEKAKESCRSKLYFKDREYYNLYEIKKTKEEVYRSDRNFGLFLISIYFILLFFTYRYIYNHTVSTWFYSGIVFVMLATILAHFKFKDEDQLNFVLLDSNRFWTYHNFKAFAWLTLKGQVIALLIGIFLAILFFIISIGIVILLYGGIGVIGLFALFRIIKAVVKK